MYEIIDQGHFETYGDINPDSYTWNIYPTELTYREDTAMYELPFDLSHVTLLGSDSHNEEVINRLQIRLNNTLIHAHSHDNCTSRGPDCVFFEYLSLNNGQIRDKMHQMYVDKYNNADNDEDREAWTTELDTLESTFESTVDMNEADANYTVYDYVAEYYEDYVEYRREFL